MWIVALALRRPYTFTVMAIMIVLLGIVTISRMATDIFPSIDIPVVSVIWGYPGVAPEEMEKRFCSLSERAMTTTVNDIEHIESQSYTGVSVVKVFFHEGANVEAAVAQVTAISQTILKQMPLGTTPPLIIQYSASDVPILQVAMSSKSISEADIYDYLQNFVRVPLATVQGAQIPFPYGGKVKQVMVDLDLEKLYAKGLSPVDVDNALNAQNLILPAGTEKIGDKEYNIRLNSSPLIADQLNDMPIREVNGAMVFIRDVGQAHAGYAVQQNIVAQNGVRSSLMVIQKSATASTLDIIDRVKKELVKIQASLPPSLTVTQLFDQSIFVRAAINGVLREGVIAACLTALMILIFLGSWRSTLVVATSIPLSILCSIIIMGCLGQTLNIMTLGGLALAVGILVDDATVEIENIHRNLAMGKPMVRAILDGAAQIAVPAFVSTLCICIVFVPVFFLSGTAKFLFEPLAMAVIFAMLASYFLSRTVVPTMVKFLLKEHMEEVHHEGEAHSNPLPAFRPQRGFFGFFKSAGQWLMELCGFIYEHFEAGFERLRDRYTAALDWVLHHRAVPFWIMGGFLLISLFLVPFLGRDFFPAVDAGQFRLHVRAPAGTRLEATAERFYKVGQVIRQVVPASEIHTVLDNIGLPVSGINLSFSDGSTIGESDGEILVALNENHHPTADYVRTLRTRLRQEFPDMEFFFGAADIVSQILNFGISAPIDVQVRGISPANYQVATDMARQIEKIPGAVDVHVQQMVHSPDLRVNVDRSQAQEVGLQQQNVASAVLISLASSGQAAPNFWLNFQNGISYTVAVQTPQYRMSTLDDLRNTPISLSGTAHPQLLGNLATFTRSESPEVIDHYNVAPVFDVLANAQGRDLGGVATDIQKIVNQYDPQPGLLRSAATWVGMGWVLDKFHIEVMPAPKIAKGNSVTVRGQVESMNSSFIGLGAGILFAIVLVYFLMVVNFQSWTDPFIIITALPGALCGIIWMLFVTGTTLNVPSLMGAIMAIGVATSNSILLVTFANDERCEGKNALEAALSAGHTRLRPVLMTALAMIIGMLPMSLGLGEGGEQNAPLGRAVIGGLLVATVATLFFVPVIYSLLRKKEFSGDPDEQFEKEANREYKERKA
jgi:multidrug efflux pump subunit AcrB